MVQGSKKCWYGWFSNTIQGFKSKDIN